MPFDDLSAIVYRVIKVTEAFYENIGIRKLLGSFTCDAIILRWLGFLIHGGIIKYSEFAVFGSTFL